MELTLHLELYREKMPDAFAGLPGAENVDLSNDNLYWAVVVPEPSAGSPEAEYIQPVGPGGGVAATSHGTDTLPVDQLTVGPTEVAIWHPMMPPYRFIVTAPAGGTVTLNPATGTSDNEHAWLGLTPPPGDGVGIWTVAVELVEAADLPKLFGDRSAHLNPAFLDFTPALFERQPLLRLTGRTDKPSGKCAELLEVAVASGCAPGTVQFTAVVESPDEVLELSWDFGDGSAVQTFGASEISAGLSTSHVYSAPGSYTVAVTALRQAGCSPLVQVKTAEVPECPGSVCAELVDLQVAGGCAQGQVQFEADVQNPPQALEIGWVFGDGAEAYFNQSQIAAGQGLAVAHTYAAAGSYTAAVTLVRQSGCSPLSQTETVAVPTCPPQPRDCPALAVVEVLSGCAPGEVSLRASVQALEGVEEITWDFGDGSESIFNAAQVAAGQGLQVSHTYTGTDPVTVVVTVLRQSGCTPRVLSETVEVPACTERPRCPQLNGIAVTGCMPRSGPPANLTIQAQGSDLSLAQQFIWEFGDGSTATTPGPSTTHSYNTNGPFGIQVTMVGPERCDPPRQTVRLDDFTISPCPPPPDNDGFIPCLLYKLLALVGLGFAIVGGILLACPLVAQPIPVQIAMGIGGVLLVVGLALLALGLLLWQLICRPDRCEWITLLWQALILLGLILVYAGFCPACNWMGLGAIFLFLGILGLLYWRRNCRPTVCKVLGELISLFLFAVNITAALAVGLYWCAISSNPVLGVIWGLAIAGIQAWLWYRANQAGCINS